MAVLHDRIRIAKAVNVKVISLDQAPQGYADFDRGVAEKFVIDPHGLLGAMSLQGAAHGKASIGPALDPPIRRRITDQHA